MGGLVGPIYAVRTPVAALVLFAPSPPAAAQVAAGEEEIAAIPDRFGSEFYGLDRPDSAATVLSDLAPAEQAFVLSHSGQESGLARRKRKRGIAIDAAAIRCPVLLIYGERDEHFPPALCRAVAAHYRAEMLAVPASRHWGIVAAASIVSELAPAVDRWLRKALHPA